MRKSHLPKRLEMLGILRVRLVNGICRPRGSITPFRNRWIRASMWLITIVGCRTACRIARQALRLLTPRILTSWMPTGSPRTLSPRKPWAFSRMRSVGKNLSSATIPHGWCIPRSRCAPRASFRNTRV